MTLGSSIPYLGAPLARHRLSGAYLQLLIFGEMEDKGLSITEAYALCMALLFVAWLLYREPPAGSTQMALRVAKLW